MSWKTLQVGATAIPVASGLFLAVSWVHAAGVGEPLPQAPTVIQSIITLLSNPNVTYLLLVAGLMALLAEVSTPGATFPGALAVIFLALALVGLIRLPTNWVGVMLIVAGLLMFLLDLKVTGIGLSIAGIVAFGLGSLLIFPPFWQPAPATIVRLNPWLAIGATAAVELFFLFGLSRAVVAQRLPVAVGRETLVGQSGTVIQELSPAGVVNVESEQWSAIAEDDRVIPVGTTIRVLGIEGLVLQVAALEPELADEGN